MNEEPRPEQGRQLRSAGFRIQGLRYWPFQTLHAHPFHSHKTHMNSDAFRDYFIGLRGAGLGKGLHPRDLDHLGPAGLQACCWRLGGFRVLSTSGFEDRGAWTFDRTLRHQLEFARLSH